MVLDLFRGIDFNYWFIKSIIALGLIIVGFVLGKLFEKGLTKLVHKFELGKKMRESFVMLSIMIITWCIYLIFINLALFQLNIPLITEFITNFLMAIPAFVSALVLISIGFTLAAYLKGVILDSGITDSKVFSNLLFYFIIYVFLLYAFRIGLFSFESQIKNYIILLLTAIFGTALAYLLVKKEAKI